MTAPFPLITGIRRPSGGPYEELQDKAEDLELERRLALEAEAQRIEEEAKAAQERAEQLAREEEQRILEEEQKALEGARQEALLPSCVLQALLKFSQQ